MTAPLLPIAVIGDSWASLSQEHIETATGQTLNAELSDLYIQGATTTLIWNPIRYEIGQKIFEIQGISNIYLSTGGADDLFWIALDNESPNSLLTPARTAERIRTLVRALTSYGHFVHHQGYQATDHGAGSHAGLQSRFAVHTSSDFVGGRYRYQDMEHLEAEYFVNDPLHLEPAWYAARIAEVDWATERDLE